MAPSLEKCLYQEMQLAEVIADFILHEVDPADWHTQWIADHIDQIALDWFEEIEIECWRCGTTLCSNCEECPSHDCEGNR